MLYAKDSVSTFEPILENIYDTHGNLIAVNDKVTNSTTEYTLDKFGNTTLQTDTQHETSVQKENTFDTENNNTSTKYTIGTNVQSYGYTYDITKPESVLKSITLPTGAIQNIENDNLGRVKEILLNTGTNKSTKLFHYLKNGDHTSNQVSSIWYGDNEKYLDNLKYKYDEKGNITEIYENSLLVAKYKYDSLSRLVREDNKRFNKTTTWEYDAGGNITNRFEYEFTLNESLGEKTPTIIPYSYASTGIRDRLMAYNGESFVYDSIGNPTTYRNNMLVWEKGRQLKSFGNIASYEYNAQGIRTKKITSNTTTQYFLDGTKILAQKDIVSVSENATTETTMNFIYGIDGVIGFTLSGQNYYYKKNLQGDIIAIYDNNLQIIAKYDYDSWGNCKISYLENNVFVDFDKEKSYNTDNTSLYIALKNPFRYRSYYYDSDTNLYYLNSRYYDPEIGRFINIDDISVLDITNIALNGINLYAYCLNNPVNEVDESGYFILAFLISLFVFAVANTAIQFVSDVVKFVATGKWESDWEDYVGAFIGGAAGGIAFVLSGFNLSIAFGVMGAVDTLFTESLTNITGKTNYSILEIIGSTLISLGIGLLGGKGIEIAGVTIGRNSFYAVLKSGLKKLLNNTASRMSIKVILKGITSVYSFKLIGTFMQGLIKSIDLSNLITKK